MIDIMNWPNIYKTCVFTKSEKLSYRGCILCRIRTNRLLDLSIVENPPDEDGEHSFLYIAPTMFHGYTILCKWFINWIFNYPENITSINFYDQAEIQDRFDEEYHSCINRRYV